MGLVHKTCQFMSPLFAKLIFLECHDSSGFCGCPTESACWIFCLQYCGLRFHIVQDPIEATTQMVPLWRRGTNSGRNCGEFSGSRCTDSVPKHCARSGKLQRISRLTSMLSYNSHKSESCT